MSAGAVSRPLILDAPVTFVPEGGGMFAAASCLTCGGRLRVDGRTRGRDNTGTPCRRVAAVLFCVPCKQQYVYEVTLTNVTSEVKAEKRWLREQ